MALPPASGLLAEVLAQVRELEAELARVAPLRAQLAALLGAETIKEQQAALAAWQDERVQLRAEVQHLREQTTLLAMVGRRASRRALA